MCELPRRFASVRRNAPASMAGAGHNSGRMVRNPILAITLDMDPSVLQASYQNACGQSAYNDIRNVLGSYGLNHQLRNVYFGDDKVDAVRCVLAVQALSRDYVWFRPAVRDIRMLRIEDNNDLMPALAAVSP